AAPFGFSGAVPPLIGDTGSFMDASPIVAISCAADAPRETCAALPPAAKSPAPARFPDSFRLPPVPVERLRAAVVANPRTLCAAPAASPAVLRDPVSDLRLFLPAARRILA